MLHRIVGIVDIIARRLLSVLLVSKLLLVLNKQSLLMGNAHEGVRMTCAGGLEHRGFSC